MSKKPSGPTTPKHSTLAVAPSRANATQDEHVADLLAGGIATNAIVATTFARGAVGESVDLTETFRALQAGGKAVQAGDLSGIEAVLSAQVVALNTIFGEMARRAAMNMGQHLDATDRYMRLAMRAQSQCRATAETLAVIKQGPPIFARQANVSHGPQQVNNGVPAASRAGEKPKSMQPELLESSDGERLDTGATRKAGPGNPALEAVGAEHRAEDAGRQGKVAAQRKPARRACAVARSVPGTA
jgi:hypothetical protein